MVFVVLACLRLGYLWFQPARLATIGITHLVAKILASVFVLSTNIVILIFAVDTGHRGSIFVWLVGPILQFISTVSPCPLGVCAATQLFLQPVLASLVVAEHIRSVAPSTLVICYASIKCIFNATALRTYFKIGTEHDARNFVILQSVSIVSYFVLTCIEVVEKRRLLKNKVCLSSYS